MSAESAHVQRKSEGESANSPVLSSPCSPITDAKYVSIFLIQLYIFFKYYIIDGYDFINIIMRIPSNQVFVLLTIFDPSINVYFFVSFIIPHWA